MTLRLRTLLLASTAPALAFAAPGLAVDVTTERTTPIATSTANNGAADNVVITSAGSVKLTSGPVAVTVDSSNTVANSGTIQITGVDNSTGIRVLGGFTGAITNSGQIILDESYTRTDTDGDGTIDGRFAQGSGRTGILIEGPSARTGNIVSNGSISIEGNSSRGISLQTGLDGSLVTGGVVNLAGDQNVGLDVRGDVTGDVRIGGSIGVNGENSTAVVVAGNVAGGFSNGGAIQSNGFQYPQVSDYFDPDDVPAGYEPPPLDADDLYNAGPALVVAGSVSQGVLNSGRVGGGAADDDEDGDDPTKDISGDFDVNRPVGSISVTGSSPAVLIAPDQGVATSGDLVIGLVVENIRDTTDDDDDDDRDEIIATFLEQHGFVNRGSIVSNGVNVGFDSNGVVIRGSADGTRNTIVQGGILNTGTLSTQAREANATTLRMGAGGQTPRLDNSGVMSAVTFTETNHSVTVLLIESDAFMGALSNTGTMTASVRGDGGTAFAIRDLSGTLLTIDNTGLVTATYTPDGDDDDGDGLTTDLDERTGQTVAIDLSAHGAGQGATIVQRLGVPLSDTDDDDDIDNDDIIPPQIAGDVRLGAGDDTVELRAGAMNGDLSFGAGADAFLVDGGATYTGALSDADGQLAMNVANGRVNLTKQTNITVTSLSLGDQSTSAYAIDLRPASAGNARIVADTISIGAGAKIAPVFVGIGSTDPTAIEILRAESGLTLAGGQSIDSNLSLETPFLFDAALATQTDGAAESVVVTVRRRTASELGMSANHAAAYEPVVAALNTDEQLLVEVVNLVDANEFYTAYNQLLPEFSVAALQFAVSNMDGAVGAVGNRLDAVRGGRSGAGAAWIQEFGQFIDRESSFSDPGYRGNGFGMAVGVDRPLGPFYAVGLSAVGAASSVEQPAGTDRPLSVTTGHVGAYAAAAAGNLLFDLYGGAGADFFESERNIVVGGVSRQSTGEWKAHHASATARIAYDLRMGRLFARPSLSADYFRMDEEGYRESGGGLAIDLAVGERSSEIIAQTAALTMGAQFGSEDRTWWSPRLRVGYRHESKGDPLLTTARYISGGDPFTLTADDLPDSGVLAGFTFAAGSRWSSFALDYDADVREGFVRHGVRVAFRFIF